MVDIKDLLDRFENPADYREVSWGGKKEEFFENLVAEKDAAVNKIIDLTNKKSLTPEIENKLNEIYFRKKAIMDLFREKDGNLTIWARKSLFSVKTH